MARLRLCKAGVRRRLAVKAENGRKQFYALPSSALTEALAFSEKVFVLVFAAERISSNNNG